MAPPKAVMSHPAGLSGGTATIGLTDAGLASRLGWNSVLPIRSSHEEAHVRSAMILCSLSFLVGCSKADNQAGRSPSSETIAGAADTAATSPMASLSAVDRKVADPGDQ